MIRKIIEIDEGKCNSCGLCANACHEGAIQLINGKAHLVNVTYCDGLGACLPHCPTGAITLVEQESSNFREPSSAPETAECHTEPGGCPGAIQSTQNTRPAFIQTLQEGAGSQLSQWPVQIKLVNIHAPYFENCDLLIAADCCAYAYAAFHQEFIRGRITLIGCPKLDDNESYIQKLTDIFAANPIHSVCVVRMEVPCCGGLVYAVKKAMLANGLILPYDEVVISVDGHILSH
jgi:Pyruvate/2-oxoacid:ferredoxin oxidoreductase delta subunit